MQIRFKLGGHFSSLLVSLSSQTIIRSAQAKFNTENGQGDLMLKLDVMEDNSKNMIV